MKYWSSTFLIVILWSCDASDNGDQVSTWYKGNLHTHSYWSDGDEFPEVVMDWYKSNGYNFVALSDHNTLAEGEKWKTISGDSIYQAAFNSYLKDYGVDWVTYKNESDTIRVKLKTYEEYKSRFEVEQQFLIIQSEEITDRYENKPIHINATNISEKIEPQGGGSVSEVLQNNINQVLEQRERTGIPMIPHINHPNFGYGVSLEDMQKLEGERFFEVYNGHPSVHNLGDSIHISTEKMWDLINISYLNNHKEIMYGIATDDAHNYHSKGKSWSNAGRGWIEVLAENLTAESLIHSMEAGDFYASTGVELKSISLKENVLTIEVNAQEGNQYEISFIGCRKGDTDSNVLKMVSGSTASFNLTDDILFVRTKVTSSKLHPNPVENMKYESAWTQPVLYK